MRKAFALLSLIIGLFLFPTLATDVTHGTLPVNNFYIIADGTYFWTVHQTTSPTTMTEFKAYDSDFNYVKTYTYPVRYYPASGVFQNVSVVADRTNNNVIALINLTTGEVYANLSVTSSFTPHKIYHVRDNLFWIPGFLNKPKMLIDLNGTLLGYSTSYADFEAYDSEYAYLFTRDMDNFKLYVEKIDLTGDSVVSLGTSEVNLSGVDTDYLFYHYYLAVPSGYGDYRVFYAQDPTRNYMQAMIYSLSTNSVIENVTTSASFLKNYAVSSSIYNSAQDVFYDILTKDVEGDLVITIVNATNGHIIDVLEKTLYGLTENENIDMYFNGMVIPVDTGDDVISFLMTVYTGKDISKIMMKDPTYGAIENVTSEVMLVETNGSIVKTSHIYTIPHTGEWGFTFGSMGATNGKTAVFTSRMRSSGQTDSFRADTFTFSGGSIFDTAYSINPSGISHLHIVNISSYGSFDQTDFELNDTIPLIFGLNDVIAEGLCGSTALQFRPIVNHTYDSLELLMYTLSESVSCIDNWVVYNVTGLDEYVRDIGLAEARAINYSGIASNDIRLVFKICSEGICKLGKWPSGVYKCYANANITYPTTGNVSRSGSTINAQLSLVDNFNNCSLTSYTANVYLDSEFVGTKTNANSSIAVPVPDNEVLYVIEAEALSFPAYYLAGTNSSVEFMMIEPPEPPAFVPEYGADDIFPQVIDVIAGIGAELSEGSVILGGILVLGVAVAIVAFKPFKLK